MLVASRGLQGNWRSDDTVDTRDDLSRGRVVGSRREVRFAPLDPSPSAAGATENTFCAGLSISLLDVTNNRQLTVLFSDAAFARRTGCAR